MRVLAATRGVYYPHKTQYYVDKYLWQSNNLQGRCIKLNIPMNDIVYLIEQGNQARADNNPEHALACYAQALTQDRLSFSAFNNYGNVLREVGDPAGAIPFLQRAVQLSPDNVTARFNLAVCYLLQGDYANGWPAYESRWQYEHLAGLLPNYSQPRWTGQDLNEKTILVIGEQGHGDNIQFLRFLLSLQALGANVIMELDSSMVPLINGSPIVRQFIQRGETPESFDYWTPIMSIPGVLGTTLDNLLAPLQYITPDVNLTKAWQERLGAKKRLRVGFCWSGRKDSWINQHKSLPFDSMLDLIKKNPNYEWINLQIDCDNNESDQLADLGVSLFPGTIRSWADTAALIQNLDVVVGVDTAVSHLSGALGRPTWIMLNNYAVDWRWLLARDSSPWYPSARLFRQPVMGDWQSVTNKIHQYLSWFKI